MRFSDALLQSMDISSLVRACIDGFKVLLTTETEHRDLLIDELGRFRVWAGNVSAHTSGRKSLQHRLRDSSELSTAVKGHLRDLLKTLDSSESPPEQLT